MSARKSRAGDASGVLIIGGGLVGASLAIALDAAGIAATLVESVAPRTGAQPSYDERNLALARASVNGLEAIGVWHHARAAATPIRHIHVSRTGEFGSARIEARKHGVEALGWTLPARELGVALLRRLDECTRLTRLAPATLSAIEPLADGWRARIQTADGERCIDTALLVGADGSESFVRGQLGITPQRHDYRQSVFVCTVTPERAHAHRAWERFADAGPVAVLPLAEGRCGLVLTVATDEADAVAALDDDDFIALAQRRFGWRLGRLSRPGKRHPFAIHRVAASQIIAPRAVLVGNAAQTVHPIGAQGFNLGLRDALTLAELVTASADPGHAAMLSTYASRRDPDREGTMLMLVYHNRCWHHCVRWRCLRSTDCRRCSARWRAAAWVFVVSRRWR